jgi:hypothetical protein
MMGRPASAEDEIVPLPVTTDQLNGLIGELNVVCEVPLENCVSLVEAVSAAFGYRVQLPEGFSPTPDLERAIEEGQDKMSPRRAEEARIRLLMSRLGKKKFKHRRITNQKLKDFLQKRRVRVSGTDKRADLIGKLRELAEASGGAHNS